MAKRGKLSWGSAAVVTAGNLTLELDEAITGPAMWGLSVEDAQVYFRFEFADLSLLIRLLDFLKQPASAEAIEMALGRSSRRQLALRRDNERGGRFILVVGGPQHILMLTLERANVDLLISALTDLVEELHLAKPASAAVAG